MAKGAADPNRPSAKALRALRAGLGVSQAQVAERAGLQRVEVVNLESGRNQATSARVQRGLARAFGLSAEEIAEVLSGRGGEAGHAADNATA
jgi:transcriptional regulator with XRE-family HTH domain